MFRPKEQAANYRMIRRENDVLYDSSLIETLLNKFTKCGKKITARRHLHQALINHRVQAPGRALYPLLLNYIDKLNRQIQLILVRKATQFLEVPVPTRRYKSIIATLQSIYEGVRARRYLNLWSRIFEEFFDITRRGEYSHALSAKSAHYAKVYELRVNMDYRWK